MVSKGCGSPLVQRKSGVITNVLSMSQIRDVAICAFEITHMPRDYLCRSAVGDNGGKPGAQA